jgi:hypothetical protein
MKVKIPLTPEEEGQLQAHAKVEGVSVGHPSASPCSSSHCGPSSRLQSTQR